MAIAGEPARPGSALGDPRPGANPGWLTTRQWRVLDAVCRTFQPSRSAADGRLLARVAGLIASLPNAEDRLRLRMLLEALGHASVNLALAGRAAPFDRLSAEDRTAVLLAWSTSRIQARRAGFQALKRLVNVAWYAWPVTGDWHPSWSAAGYPGPLPRPAAPAQPPPAIADSAGRLPELAVTADTTVECDVVVCGSGAGGGVVAGILAEAGLDVVVLEAGPSLGPGDFTQVEGDMLSRAYLDGGLLMSRSGSLPILAGACVGGGTVINWTSSFALPEATRAQWDRISGLGLFSSAEFQAAVERVSARLDVNLESSPAAPRDQVLERGLRALGWDVAPIPRNARGCPSDLECGYCGLGCRHGTKRSTAATYLADALAAGARLVAGATADRVILEQGRAVGVEATVRRTRDPRVAGSGAPARLTVRARRAVVAACGALHTPALLLRSGVESRHLGRGLHLHPVTAVGGVFPERIEPWTGQMQTRGSRHVADVADGYGAMLETGPIHWALPASAFGWDGPDRHRADVERLGNISVAGILLRDRDPGRVVLGRDGRPRVDYELSAFDGRNLRVALEAAARVVAAAGATELLSLHQPPVRAVAGAPGWVDRFVAELVARDPGGARMALISFHQMGTAAMGAGPRAAVTDEAGAVFGVRGLYVADGSLFPSSSGVNPMLTIMTLADLVARGIATR